MSLPPRLIRKDSTPHPFNLAIYVFPLGVSTFFIFFVLFGGLKRLNKRPFRPKAGLDGKYGREDHRIDEDGE
jgi:hypothetical protein